jgi:hypothetical protein
LRSLRTKALALLRRRSVQIALPLGVAVIAGAVVMVLVMVNDDDDQSTTTRRPEAVAGSLQQIELLARTVRHPIYWAGERAGYTQELTRTRDGGTYVRYLPPGVQLGDKRADFLTIGTYVQRNAIAAVRRIARHRRAFSKRLRGGALAASTPSKPESVYFARPDSDLLAEVYDPSPARARRLVRSDELDLVRR